ncbi:VQ motif-containing protein 9 [Raphanus sativus]|uniref:VQ motif-containing protein 9-like n=1 Tax=Raphanus sativus TaxID=3726 RepID=A0A6J0LX96_RAPSA|nr:VQ motif-containing protein 9-like [Raphanus sativus]KAJ4909111.1 VQ motif-containing protein 9 [Raphanus sativus]
MDKSSNSSALSATAASSTCNNKDHHYLRQLNKLSHKISKPTPTSSFSVSAALNQENSHQPLPPPPPPQPPMNHQPPVYNINKNDFRNVVQKLTGSPAHERISSPPPPRQQSSRLHRIRPPPLAHVINRPPSDAHRRNSSGVYVPRPTAAPLSPLPPLPPVHAAAESPVSSYMRYLQSSMFSGLLSPLAPLVSPSLLLSPTSGQVGFQVSPTTVPLPSPKKFKGH